jgi:glycosyltransferase involved in cell wall biosynthesis
MRVALFGFHGEASGYGVATALHGRALARVGLDVRLHEATRSQYVTRSADVAIVHCPVDRLHTFLPAARVVAPRVVLFSVWETSTLPPGWADAARQVSSLWVPSELAAHAFAAAKRPIAVVPHPIAPARTVKRSFPGIRDTDTVFFAVLEWQARKNGEGVLRAFVEAFRGREDIVLLLKVGFLFHGDPDDVLARIATIAGRGLPRVIVLVDTLSAPQLRRVLQRADALVSLHRAEGFGLVVAEAAARAIPTVCSATGGPQEFLAPEAAFWVGGTRRPVGLSQGHPFTPEMTWFEPDHDAAVEALRRCARDVVERTRRGVRARESVRARLDPRLVGERMRALLEDAP